MENEMSELDMILSTVPCEECGEHLFTGEPRIKMDGLVYCSGPCALEEVA